MEAELGAGGESRPRAGMEPAPAEEVAGLLDTGLLHRVHGSSGPLSAAAVAPAAAAVAARARELDSGGVAESGADHHQAADRPLADTAGLLDAESPQPPPLSAGRAGRAGDATDFCARIGKHRRGLALFVAAALACSAAVAATQGLFQPARVRVLPIGDSITAGWGDSSCLPRPVAQARGQSAHCAFAPVCLAWSFAL